MGENENNISCNKDKNLEDVEKSNQKLLSSGKLPDNEEDKINELDKVYKKENFHNSFSQATQQNMLDEIGKLSKAINLDELDKRLNRHFKENEEDKTQKSGHEHEKQENAKY